MILGTIIIYIFSKRLYQRFPSPFLIPMTIALIVIITILSLFHLSYETYMIGGKWLNELLGPGVVALAYPLYLQRATLKKLASPILIGTGTGAVVGVLTGLGLTKSTNFSSEILYSLSPKSVTTPVAVSIVESVGGIPSLAAVFVMIAGIGGTMISTFIFKGSSIQSPISQSIGLGCGSHVIGITKAMEYGQQEGAVSSITMILSAVFVSVIIPVVIVWFV